MAAVVSDGTSQDIYVVNLERGVPRRLTDGGGNYSPVWTPDGERIVFQSGSGGDYDLYVMSADGGDSPRPLTHTEAKDWPSSVRSDGTLAFTTVDQAYDIWTLQIDSDAPPVPLVVTADDEANGIFSADGEWIAFEVTQGGEAEIEVQKVPTGRRIPVSNRGGVAPIWSPSSTQLFYLEGGERMMVVDYEITGGEFRPRAPRPLFELRPRMIGWPHRLFDIYPDGEHFVMPQGADLSKAKVVLVQNWFEELKRNER